MEKVEIITDESKISDIADEVTPAKDAKLVQGTILKLKSIIREKDLHALSAPQIGINARIFCIRFGKDDIRSYCNPLISKVKGIHLSRESCSSLPDREFIRIRHPEINVIYMTPLGKIKSEKLIGAAAYLFQHHVDHLNGLLLSDVALEIDKDWDKATEAERNEVIAEYLDSIDIKTSEANREVAKVDELKQLDSAVSFIKEVQDGTTKLGKSISVKKEKGEQVDGEQSQCTDTSGNK